MSVRPSVRTTISPAVFIGFFQYRTQGIITMSRASWKKLLFFFRVIFGPFSAIFRPFRPSVRTTISPAVFIGFFQYRTQGIITMSRASWEKLFFFRVIFGPFSAIFRPFRPSVPLYLLQFLSDSFNIAHRASLQCRGRHGRNFFFFRVIFGSFSAIFRLKIKIL